MRQFEKNWTYLKSQWAISRFKRKSLCILILSLIAISQSTFSQTNKVLIFPDKPLNFSCLDRHVKESIEVCFEENEQCHRALELQAKEDPQISWKMIALYLLSGFAVGVLIDQRVK